MDHEDNRFALIIELTGQSEFGKKARFQGMPKFGHGQCDEPSGNRFSARFLALPNTPNKAENTADSVEFSNLRRYDEGIVSRPIDPILTKGPAIPDQEEK